MRWLITGAGGQLAHHLAAQLGAGPDEVTLLDKAELDITRAEDVRAAVGSLRPDVLVNAAAYTAVDAAETSEPLAHAVNATGPGLLAAALADTGGWLLHVSTDYVFSGVVGGVVGGSAAAPYEPDDAPQPRTVYGRTKLAGERAVLAALPGRATVVRTAWVHGGPGPNFVATMLRLAASDACPEVVDDQVGSPTYAGDLAAALIELGRSGVRSPVLHYVNAGRASWCELARAVFAEAGADPARVRAVDSAAVPRPAPRPAWSVLSTAAWTACGLSLPRPWQDGVRDSVTAQRGLGVVDG
jgi:dTDP-4-dehydrorhamnose reductase